MAVVAVGVLLLAAVALVFFVSARRESDRAKEQATRATALALASQSTSLQRENPALALALAVESSATSATPLSEARAALFAARVAFGERSWQPIRMPLAGHQDVVKGVAFSPTARCSHPLVTIAPCDCGIRVPASLSATRSSGRTTKCLMWRSAPTARYLPPPISTSW